MLTRVLHLKQFATSRQGVRLGALVLGAIAIRLPLLLFHGYYDDLGTYVQWGDSAVQHLATLYSPTNTGGFGNHGGGFGGGSQGVNYPPAMPFLFGMLVWLFSTLLSPLVHASLAMVVRSDGLGPFFAKLPILLADVGVVILLYREARRRHSARFALLVAAAYAFSPAVLYDGAIWGQTDGLVSLPLLVAIFAILGESYMLGGVSLALAILLKPQPLIFVPLILIYLWRWRTWQNFMRFTAAGIATVLIGLLPIMIPRFQVVDMVNNIQSQSYNASALLTSDAFNFWWLVGDQNQMLGAPLLGMHASTVGDMLFGTTTLIIGMHLWRHRAPIDLCFGLAIQIFGFFLFMGGQHERYLFMFIPLMLACIVLVPRQDATQLVRLFVIGSVLCFLNMLIGVGGGSFASSELIPFLALPALSDFFAASLATLGMLLAFAQCATFAYALIVYVNPPQAPFAHEEPDMSAPLSRCESQPVVFATSQHDNGD